VIYYPPPFEDPQDPACGSTNVPSLVMCFGCDYFIVAAVSPHISPFRSPPHSHVQLYTLVLSFLSGILLYIAGVELELK